MNILILYLVVTDELKTLYDIDGKYDHVTTGTFVHDSNGVAGWVIDRPGSVQEGNRMLREEWEWLLEQGKACAQTRIREREAVKGVAAIVYDPQTDKLATVVESGQQYCVKLGTAVNGTYVLSLWHDCTDDNIPTFMQVEQLDKAHREYFLKQGRACAQSVAAAPQ